MTTLREAAMRQALEALEYHVEQTRPIDRTSEAIAALKAALAEPMPDYERGFIDGMQEQMKRSVDKAVNAMTRNPAEPVAWRFQSAVGGWAYGSQPPLGSKYPAYPLYTSPPQRKPLTEEEIDELAMDKDGLPNSHIEFARAIERAHGICE